MLAQLLFQDLKLSFFQLPCIILGSQACPKQVSHFLWLLHCHFQLVAHLHLPLMLGKCQAAPQPPVLVS